MQEGHMQAYKISLVMNSVSQDIEIKCYMHILKAPQIRGVSVVLCPQHHNNTF